MLVLTKKEGKIQKTKKKKGHICKEKFNDMFIEDER